MSDQYANPVLASMWGRSIGDSKIRVNNYKETILKILNQANCRRILDVACGNG